MFHIGLQAGSYLGLRWCSTSPDCCFILAELWTPCRCRHWSLSWDAGSPAGWPQGGPKGGPQGGWPPQQGRPPWLLQDHKSFLVPLPVQSSFCCIEPGNPSTSTLSFLAGVDIQKWSFIHNSWNRWSGFIFFPPSWSWQVVDVENIDYKNITCFCFQIFVFLCSFTLVSYNERLSHCW